MTNLGFSATHEEIVQFGQQVIQIEIQEVSKLASRLDKDFVRAVEAIVQCAGKVVVSGMGKSGHIGKKISATLSSTGSTSMYLHPAEAYHGDLGAIHPSDVVVLISNSGETDEILKIIPFLLDQGNFIIAFTGNPKSTLATAAHCMLHVGVDVEACNLNLAPTSSTTATLVMGDALAVAVMKCRGFRQEDFARFHPGGNLGRKLLTKVKNAMVSDSLPFISPNIPAMDAMHAISNGRLGVAIVVDDANRLLGIITDGDVRRATLREKHKLFDLQAGAFMTKLPRTTSPDVRLIEAEEVMDKLNIHQLVVVDENNTVVGLLPYRKAR